MTVSGDGAVPIHYRLTDGNTSDSSYHIEVWETLTKLVGRADFVYFADSKLASRHNMDHIHRGGGRFISVLPRSRKEDAEFRDWVKAHRPSWVVVRDDTSEGAAPDVFLMAEAPWPSAEGYRVAWILSSAKAAKDAEARRARIAATSRRLEDLAARLRGPKARIRSIEGADGAVKKILAETGTEAFFSVQLKASTETTLRRLEPREGSGAEGRYRRIDRTRIELTWEIDATLVAAEAASDGMFPLITKGGIHLTGVPWRGGHPSCGEALPEVRG